MCLPPTKINLVLLMSTNHWHDLWFLLNKCLKNISSGECKKVVSAFSSFCRKSNFVLRFPLYFIVFWHLISSINVQILWVRACTIAQNVSLYLNFQYLWKTQFHPNCHLRPFCIHMTIWFIRCSLRTLYLSGTIHKTEYHVSYRVTDLVYSQK